MDTKTGQVVMAALAIPVRLIWWALVMSVLVNAALLVVNLGLLYLTHRHQRSESE